MGRITRRAAILACLVPCLGAVPASRVLTDHVDLCEQNEFLDENCTLVLSQTIWWQYVGWLSEYRVVAWRLGDAARPRYCYRRQLWVSHWWDAKTKAYRRVYASLFRATRTQHDPEVADRANLPCELRRGLLTISSESG